MHQLRACLLLVVLAGCAGQPSLPTGSFRPPDAPIWSIAQLDPSRLPGRWQQVAAFAGAETGCRPGGAEIAGRPGALSLAARLCLNGSETRLSGTLRPAGPGRFQISGQDWWVIWVDADYRTLAIGTPSGAFGFILNRGGALPPDRLKAAREIFDFNGYDTARLIAY